MLIGVIGTFGSGKTLLLTIFGYNKSFDRNTEVYANFNVKTEKGNPKVKVIEPEDFLDVNPKEKKALVLLDEVYAWLESRASMTRVNRFLSYVVLQSRKRNMDIVYSCQLAGSIDLRLRNLTDVVITCEKRTAWNNKTHVNEPCFVYRVFWQKNLNVVKKYAFVLSWNKALVWFKRFDTREIVRPVFTVDWKSAKKHSRIMKVEND